MIIGIDASRAFLKKRTGIEEYSYQVIKHLRKELKDEQVVLYVRKKFIIQNVQPKTILPEIDFELPEHWQVRGLWAPRFWTQFRLSLEMLVHRPDVLFVPAHTVPLVHPRRTIVTVHGLEYEFCPEAYSLWERWYMRLSIWFSCRWAERIIAVSENTKSDLMRLYGVAEEKIRVVYEGYNNNFEFRISNFESNQNSEISELNIQSKFKIQNSKFLLFIGRIEERKNVGRIIEAFEILKEKHHIPHRLVLAGKPGYGYERIKNQESRIRNQNDIIELGYVTEEEKWELLKNAEVFLFPSLYEGFGIPVLEAQSVAVPIVTSKTSSLPEVGGDGAVYADPFDARSIAEGIRRVLQEKDFRDDILQKGLKNRGRFSWGKCAREITFLLKER